MGDPPGPGASHARAPGVKEKSFGTTPDGRPARHGRLCGPIFEARPETHALQTDRSTARLRRARRRAVSREGLGGGGRRRSGPPDAVLVVGADGLGYLGVPLFFVISGLCIHLPAARALAAGRSAAPRWREFFRRRFWRLHPPYLAALALAAGLLFATRGELPVSWRGAVAEGFLVHTLHPRHVRGSEPAGLDAGARGAILSRVSRGLDPLRTPRRLAWARGRHGDDHALPRQLELGMDTAGAWRRRVGSLPGALVRMGTRGADRALGGRPRDDTASRAIALGRGIGADARGSRRVGDVAAWLVHHQGAALRDRLRARGGVDAASRARRHADGGHGDRPTPRRDRRLFVQPVSRASPDPVLSRAGGEARGGCADFSASSP